MEAAENCFAREGLMITKKAVGTAIIVVGVTAAVFLHSKPDPLSDPHSVLPQLPQQQQAFVDALAEGFKEYDAAKNEFSQGAARVHRAQRLCALGMPRTVENWIGTVKTLSSNSSGYGVLAIQIAEHASVTTDNNDFTDRFGGLHTLIKPDDPVYTQLSQLHEGMPVAFSGILGSSDTDCFAEDSVTQSGSMTDPQFFFHFTGVRPLSPPS